MAQRAPARDEPAEDHDYRSKVQQVVSKREARRCRRERSHLRGVREELAWIETRRRANPRIISAQNAERRRLDDHEYEIKRAHDVEISGEGCGEARAAAQHAEQQVNDSCEP